MNSKTYLVSISLDEDDQKKLEEYIKRSNKTKKQILEEAISEYLGCRSQLPSINRGLASPS